MTESAIDYSDIPPLDESFFKKETVTLPQKKDSITLRIDHDGLEFFKHQGRGYQTLINAVLKTYAHAKSNIQRINIKEVRRMYSKKAGVTTFLE
jgi:uncharacterized protein (DUF4415 family)